MADSNSDDRPGYWPIDRKRYERECLEEAVLAAESLPSRDDHVGEVRLEGAYPDTRIVIELKHSKHPTTSWRLWEEDFGAVGPYGQAGPGTVGHEISVFLFEHALGR